MNVFSDRGGTIPGIGEQTDEELMTLYQQGDYDAFRALYARHCGRVFGYLKKRVRNLAEAEDLLQQVFLRLHRYRDRYEIGLPFLPWLFAIARYALIDFTRKRKATPVDEESLVAIADKQGLDEVPERDVSETWDDLMTLLPAEQRKVFEMRFQKDLSFDQIAGELGLSSVTVRKRVSRSIQSLRKSLFGKKGAKS